MADKPDKEDANQDPESHNRTATTRKEPSLNLRPLRREAAAVLGLSGRCFHRPF